jgi:hypothetical protein
VGLSVQVHRYDFAVVGKKVYLLLEDVRDGRKGLNAYVDLEGLIGS